MMPPGVGRRAFGHAGAGGSLAFADPDVGLGFGYVMNQMQLGMTGDRRTETLVAATYSSLG
jgi:CubicO group peptidase (beta-lactamase class C family)